MNPWQDIAAVSDDAHRWESIWGHAREVFAWWCVRETLKGDQCAAKRWARYSSRAASREAEAAARCPGCTRTAQELH